MSGALIGLVLVWCVAIWAYLWRRRRKRQQEQLRVSQRGR
jgi:hypothetical protein